MSGTVQNFLNETNKNLKFYQQNKNYLQNLSKFLTHQLEEQKFQKTIPLEDPFQLSEDDEQEDQQQQEIASQKSKKQAGKKQSENPEFSHSHEKQDFQMYQNKLLKQEAQEGILTSTKLVPEKLKKSLLTNIQNFKDSQTIIDYHPGSDNMVRDIIHQSMYLYKKGVTEIIQNQEKEEEQINEEEEVQQTKKGKKKQTKKAGKGKPKKQPQAAQKQVLHYYSNKEKEDEDAQRYVNYSEDESYDVENHGYNEFKLEKEDKEENFYDGISEDFEQDSHESAEQCVYRHVKFTKKIKKTQFLTDFWGREYSGSEKYQWIPSNVKINPSTNECKFTGYVNNLPESQQSLKSDLEDLLQIFVPQFDFLIKNYISQKQFCDEINSKNNIKMFDKKKNSIYDFDQIQVIPKIVEYTFKPGQKYEGVWHIEGMSNENIIATGVYFPKMDDILKGGKLTYKRNLTLKERQSKSLKTMTQEELDNECIPLGQIQTSEDTTVVFPNCHVHKLEQIVNSSEEVEGNRMLIAFFLVNPNTKILSSSSLPAQQDKISYKEACEWRLEMMDERKYLKAKINSGPATKEVPGGQQYTKVVRFHNFCEH